MRTYARTQLSPTRTANSGVLLQVLPQYQSPSTVASDAATFVVVHLCRPVGLWVRRFVGPCLKYFVLETYFRVWTICCIMSTLVHTHTHLAYFACACVYWRWVHANKHSTLYPIHLSCPLCSCGRKLLCRMAGHHSIETDVFQCVFSSCRCMGSWILALRMAWILSYISSAMTYVSWPQFSISCNVFLSLPRNCMYVTCNSLLSVHWWSDIIRHGRKCVSVRTCVSFYVTSQYVTDSVGKIFLVQWHSWRCLSVARANFLICIRMYVRRYVHNIMYL